MLLNHNTNIQKCQNFGSINKIYVFYVHHSGETKIGLLALYAKLSQNENVEKSQNSFSRSRSPHLTIFINKFFYSTPGRTTTAEKLKNKTSLLRSWIKSFHVTRLMYINIFFSFAFLLRRRAERGFFPLLFVKRGLKNKTQCNNYYGGS